MEGSRYRAGKEAHQGAVLWGGPVVTNKKVGAWMPVMLGMVIAREGMATAKRDFPPISPSQACVKERGKWGGIEGQTTCLSVPLNQIQALSWVE